MKNRKREICTSGSVRDEAGQPPHLLGGLVARRRVGHRPRARSGRCPLSGSSIRRHRKLGSLARPGGNATGVTVLTNDLMAKRIEALHSTVPSATAIALLTNSTNPVVGNAEAELAQQAAQALGLNVTVFNAGTPDDIEAAFTALARQSVGALVVSADPLFLDQRDRLSTLTARHGIPSIYSYRANVAAGGLMSYGAAFAESYRLVGVYTGRILKGDKAADLPVQQVTKLELVINLKTAKALGLTIPETLLATADEVIQ
jgi:putative tryptophan/tyrosine transport system substrate-binding protein